MKISEGHGGISCMLHRVTSNPTGQAEPLKERNLGTCDISSCADLTASEVKLSYL